MSENQEQPSQATEQPSQPSSESQFAVPDAYKDRGWAEKIKTPDDLWKTLDNTQSLLGKRPAGIPTNDAPDEEWQKFYQAARPEKADDYSLGDIEGMPEGVDLAPYKAQAQNLMYEVGLTKKQADTMWKQYVGAEMGAVKTASDALDKKYDETLNSLFGDKRADAEKTAQEAIKQYLPEDMRGSIGALAGHPEAMGAVIKLANEMNAALQSVKKEYGAEGGLPGSGAQAAGESINDTVSRLAKLRLSPEAQDFTKPGHAKVMDEIKGLQAAVARHYNK